MKEPASEHVQYSGMLAIPYANKTGVVAWKFRNLGRDAQPKYLGPAGSNYALYNIGSIHDAVDRIIIVEGELDAVACQHATGIPTVGVPGASAWKALYARLFDGLTPIIVTDNDEKESGSNPGQDLAARIAGSLPWAETRTLPVGLDINETVMQHGFQYLRDLVAPDKEAA